MWRMATTTAGLPPTHPRLISADQLRARVQPVGWSPSDSLFLLLVFAAVAICALVPLALL